MHCCADEPHGTSLAAVELVGAARTRFAAKPSPRREQEASPHVAALMPHHYAFVALLSTASALLPRLAPQQQRRAPVRHILDNSQDDPIARFERENDGGKRRPFLAYASRRRRRVAAEAPSLRASSREP